MLRRRKRVNRETRAEDIADIPRSKYLKPAAKLKQSAKKVWKPVENYHVFSSDLKGKRVEFIALCNAISAVLSISTLMFDYDFSNFDFKIRGAYYSFEERKLYVRARPPYNRIPSIPVRQAFLDRCVPLSRIVRSSMLEDDLEIALTDGRVVVINSERIECLTKKEYKEWDARVSPHFM